jgi:diguanylate cyclase (GGDEF)-like protein
MPSLTDIVHGLAEPALVVDPGARIEAANQPFAMLLGVRYRQLAQLVGTPLDELVKPRARVPDEHDEANAQTTARTAPSIKLSVAQAAASCRPCQLAELRCCVGEAEDVVLWVNIVPVDEGKRLLVVLRDVSSDARIFARYRDLLAEARARASLLERSVEERTRELREALDQVTRLARTDALTGLWNRRAFNEFASHQLAVSARYARPAAVAILDLDHFKLVNDTFGHAAGDELLCLIAETLRESVRTSDAIGRLGGEEFGLYLGEVQGEEARCTVERVRLAIASRPTKHMRAQTASIGVAMFPEDGTTLDALLTSADRALYRAKEQGRDRVEFQVDTEEAARS